MENKQVIKAGWMYLYSNDFLLFERKPKLDKRKNFDKAVLIFIEQNKGKIDKKRVLTLRKQRHNKLPVHSNVLTSPITKDWLSNRQNLKTILSDRLVFKDGRNHHAKNNFDLKIISILKNNERSI